MRWSETTAEARQEFLELVEKGAFQDVAAEAAGLCPEAVRRWVRRGGQARAREPFKTFAREVKRAAGQARARAEMAVWEKSPDKWLRYGPGKETVDRVGWSAAVKGRTREEQKEKERQEAAVFQGIVTVMQEVLRDYPEAREAVERAVQVWRDDMGREAVVSLEDDEDEPGGAGSALACVGNVSERAGEGADAGTPNPGSEGDRVAAEKGDGGQGAPDGVGSALVCVETAPAADGEKLAGGAVEGAAEVGGSAQECGGSAPVCVGRAHEPGVAETGTGGAWSDARHDEERVCGNRKEAGSGAGTGGEASIGGEFLIFWRVGLAAAPAGRRCRGRRCGRRAALPGERRRGVRPAEVGMAGPGGGRGSIRAGLTARERGRERVEVRPLVSVSRPLVSVPRPARMFPGKAGRGGTAWPVV